MKNKDVFVSVIIPTHNRADCVSFAIDSVLNQTHTNLECIVVSDGSTDNTDEIVRAYEIKDERVKYISYHPAAGGNRARNTGIKVAQYEYIAFLDDDDRWHPDKLEKQLAVFSSDAEIGLVCTGIKNIYAESNITSVYIPKVNLDSSKEILIWNTVGSTTTVMTKKSVLEKSGIFDENLKALQDYDLWVRICQHERAAVVEEALVDYYHLKGNNQVSAHTERYIDALEKINEKYSNLIGALSEEDKNMREYKFMMLLAKKGLRNAEPKIARKYAKKAFKKCKKPDAVKCWIASFLPYKLVLKLKK